MCEISGRPVDRVYVNSHQSMQKPIDEDRLSMKILFSLNVFIVYVYVNLGRSMLFNFVIDLKSIGLQILVSHRFHCIIQCCKYIHCVYY